MSHITRHRNDETTWEQMLKDRDEKDRTIVLLTEQLRVSDVAYNYWTKRCRELEEVNERANKLIEDEANKRAEIQGRLDEWKFNEEAWGNDAQSIRTYIRKLRELCGEAATYVICPDHTFSLRPGCVHCDAKARLQSAAKGDAL